MTEQQIKTKKIKDFSSSIKLDLMGEIDSTIKGPKGNVEHFLWLKHNSAVVR